MNDVTLRILAVSPRFAPTNGADTHRLRLLLNHAAASGWQVEVLAVDSADVVGPSDPWLEDNLPCDVAVHRVRAMQLRAWGLNGLAQRSIWPLYRKGCELLAAGQFDLVFFSTTEFALHILGPLWKRKYRVPFCMDYQDPWVSDYYNEHPEVVPPGGRLKYALADRVHRVMERFTVRHCSGYVAVSKVYLSDLLRRYGDAVAGKPMLVRPFPAEPMELASFVGTQSIGGGSERARVWRYIGCGGPVMARSASAFFRAWEAAELDGTIQAGMVRFEALGTSYAAAGQGEKSIATLVEGTLLADLVTESPDRLGYSKMLSMLIASDALVVFGSDDPSYTASKIYPYLLAGKPLLAILHRASSVVGLMKQLGGGACVTFDEHTTDSELMANIKHAWFERHQFDTAISLDVVALEPYTARAQAAEIGHWMREVLATHRQAGRAVVAGE